MRYRQRSESPVPRAVRSVERVGFRRLLARWSSSISFIRRPVRQSDWLIGAGILAKGIHGVALRSMKAPGTAFDDPKLGKDDQPADMAHYALATTTAAFIPIPAYPITLLLVATALGGHSWEKAGQIWYDTLIDHNLKANSSFATFAESDD